MSDLEREAKVRWLKPPEIFFILQNHENHMISHETPQRPASNILLLMIVLLISLRLYCENVLHK